MTNREILEDFIVFYFLKYEELCSKVVFFFNQENGELLFNDSFEDSRYKNFIRHYIHIEEFIDNEFKPIIINSLHDLISEDNIKNLVQYLNESFSHGYSLDDEPAPGEKEDVENNFIGFYNLDINKNDFISEFNNNYLELYKLNTNFYISYLYQFFYHNYSNANYKFKKAIEEIDRILINKSIFPFEENGEVDKYYDNKYKNLMLDSLQLRPFQIFGYFGMMGIFFDDKLTFRNWVIASKTIKLKYEFDSLSSDLIGVDYMIYKYFRYKFYIEGSSKHSFRNIDSQNSKLESLKNNESSKKVQNLKKTLFDFIYNVIDKEGFINGLRKEFRTEKGIEIRAIINKLEEERVFVIGAREFKNFRDALEKKFDRKIGTYQSIQNVKDIDNSISEKINIRLNPIIKKYKV